MRTETKKDAFYHGIFHCLHFSKYQAHMEPKNNRMYKHGLIVQFRK
jgi:hypothetical protein